MAGTLFFFRIFRETGRATDLARQKAWLAASSGCTQEAVELSSQGTMLQELSATPSPSGSPGPSATAIPPVPAGFDEVSGAAPASIDSRKATAVVPIHASTGTGPSSAFEYKGEARLTLLCNEVPKAGDLVSAAVDTFGRLTQW
jgi:hypothetical protein